jgi:hypothetical protein
MHLNQQQYNTLKEENPCIDQKLPVCDIKDTIT